MAISGSVKFSTYCWRICFYNGDVQQCGRQINICQLLANDRLFTCLKFCSTFVHVFLVCDVPSQEADEKTAFLCNGPADVECHAFRRAIHLRSLFRWDSLIGPRTDACLVSIFSHRNEVEKYVIGWNAGICPIF